MLSQKTPERHSTGWMACHGSAVPQRCENNSHAPSPGLATRGDWLVIPFSAIHSE